MPGFVINGTGGHINGNSAQRDYYYNYTWTIINLMGSQIDKSSPLISLKDMTLPTFNVNKDSYNGSGLEYKHAKGVVWDDITVTWYDTVGLHKIVTEWRKSVWTKECGLRPPGDYKKRSILNDYLPDGTRSREWTLINSWPSSIKQGDLTYTNSDAKIVQVTVTYDWCDEPA